jgi:hypothetical protein
MSVTTNYEGYCVWQIAEDGNVWTIEGNGSGVWTILITNQTSGDLLWQGQKTGSVGTFAGDTPEGTYTKTGGCDSTASRTVAAICNKLAATTGQACCVTYTVLVSGTSTGLDGLWTLKQFTGQYFWSSGNSGGSRPSSAHDASWSSADDSEMVIYTDGENWILAILNSPICTMRFTAPLESSNCPPTTGWTYLDEMASDVAACATPSISVSTSGCP